LILSDGLDALALTDPGHLQPYLDALAPAFASSLPAGLGVVTHR